MIGRGALRAGIGSTTWILAIAGFLAAPAAAQVLVPDNWGLRPSGIEAGDSFRLIFVSSTKRDATSDDIADYNSFIQARAAAGHKLIRPYSNDFKALGSTADDDARDNTASTHTDSDPGVPIYWVDGSKVADDYADFYDGSWDSQASFTDESGNSSSTLTSVWTGSAATGVWANALISVHGLGDSSPAIGQIGTSSGGPIFSASTSSQTNRHSLYGLSPVFTVHPTVPDNWGLIPSGLELGDSFRLLFLSDSTRTAAASDIATYNTWVQGEASRGHNAIQDYASHFRVVGSTVDVDARDNTSTTYTDDDKGVPIYWVDGNKVADDYEDFYDGSWDDVNNPRSQSGSRRPSSLHSSICTGSQNNGTERSISGTSVALGEANVGLGRLYTSGQPLNSSDTLFYDPTQSANSLCGYYALSPVLTIRPRRLEVAPDWALTPPGLVVGDSFRLLFLTSTERDATSTDIADYNTFVQGRADDGHRAIQRYSDRFRVVGSTAETDARDNTSTTYTDDDKGVPIYWVNGNKVADDYEDFYDWSWDDQANVKSEFGTDHPSGAGDVVFTGSWHDGTGVSVNTLGSANVRVGRPHSDSATSGPLSSQINNFSTLTKPFYALSPVFTVWGDYSDVLLRADLTVGISGTLEGFSGVIGSEVGALSDRSFQYRGRAYRITWLNISTSSGNPVRYLATEHQGRAVQDLVLILDGKQFPFRDSTTDANNPRAREWSDSGLDWERGQVVKVLIKFVDGPPLLTSRHAVNQAGTGLTLNFDENLASASDKLPPTSAFTVTVNGSAVSVASVSVGAGDSQKSLVLSLGAAIEMGATVTVSYADPTSGDDDAALQDDAGNDVFPFTDVAVTNNSTRDFTPPRLGASGHRVTQDGLSILLDYTEDLEDEAGRLPATSAFIVVVDGGAVSVASVSVGAPANVFRLNFDDSIKALQSVTVSYADPTSGNDAKAIQDESGNDAASFADLAVPNESTVPSEIPDAPTDLTATAVGKNQIDLDWTAAADHQENVVSGYKIEGSDNAGTDWSVLVADTGSTATAYSDTTLEPNSTRHYRVSAINSLGTGPVSNVADATTHSVDPPDAPTGLTATANGKSRIDLSWTAPDSDPDGIISGYRIEWRESGGAWYDLVSDTGSTATTYSNTGLKPNTKRYYRVSAINVAGPGSPSDTAVATTDLPDAVEVLPNWGLMPEGIVVGDSFRLLFLSSSSRTATAGDIATYNTWVQSQASFGHSAIREHASTFRVVGSTADVDARDNTSTTYTADDKGVPIYWLNGSKVADDYEDFYDGSWGDVNNPKEQGGSRRPSSSALNICTGSLSDGTERSISGTSVALGEDNVGLGRLYTDAPPLTSNTTLIWSATQTANTHCALYALSIVFTVVPHQVEVAPDWELTPSGLEVGDSFRLLFLSSTKRNSSSTDIADYNTFVQARAGAGHEAIQPYSQRFRVVGTTSDTDARDNTATTYTSKYKGVPIYWVDGSQVADDYEDFYDGSWDDEANPRNEHGSSTSDRRVWTGSTHAGTQHSDAHSLGDPSPALGRLDDSSAGPLAGYTLRSGNTVQLPFYALSPVFTVAIPTTDIPSDSNLVPTGFGPGQSFRVLFVSSTTRDATSSDIADYNSFIQARAAAGHELISPYSTQFKALGSTAGTDARDNTASTHTDFDPGVPIYWLDGSKVADNYADFYDGSWDNQDSFTDELGNSSSSLTPVWTGSDSTGVRLTYTLSLHGLGDSLPAAGQIGISSGGPIFSANTTQTSEYSLYGLSPVFDVIAPPPKRPEAITDLAAVASLPTQIDLDWTAPDDNNGAITGYRIEVSTDAGANWSVLVANTGSTGTSYPHRGLLPGSSRHYRVSAINSAGAGPASNIDDATTPYAMLQVNFGASSYDARERATAASVAVRLSQAPRREVAIQITATSQGGAVEADYSVVPTMLTFGAAETSKTITVTAMDDTDDEDGESVQLGFDALPEGIAAGSQATTTVNLLDEEAMLPATPTDLIASANGSTRVDLTWSAPESDGGAAISGYRIEASTDAGASWTDLVADTASTDTSYSHTGLAAGAYRHYRVSAINSVGTGPASNVAGATTPVDFGANSELVPSALSVGNSFRLLFLSSTTRDASSTDIADYNTFVQERAAAGHADIQTHSALFRALGCTAGADARDNTVTTGTGVPIYWLNGLKAADDHVGFYDGEWDNETNDDDRDESGTNSADITSSDRYPFTGCAHDGTEAFNASNDSLALGASGNVAVGRPGSAASGDGPLGSTAHTASSGTRPLYGLSPVLRVIAAVPGAITDLAATAGGPTQIDLGWTAPDANGADISGYKIEVSPDGSSDWTELVADTASTATSYSHTGLLPAATRHYRVSAINSAGTGPVSNVDDATTPFPMLTVEFGAAAYTATEGGTDALVTVTLSGMPLRQVEISVTATNQGATANADYSGVPVTLTFAASETSRTITVTATVDSDDDDGETVQLGFDTLPAGIAAGSQATATVTLAETAAVVPGAPTELAASAAGSTQIDLAWSAPESDGGAAISGYHIEASTDAGAAWTAGKFNV